MTLSSVKRRTAHQQRALAAEIVEVLQRLGGAAHRDVVLERVMAARRNAGKLVDGDFRPALVKAFEAFRDHGPNGAETPLFTLPFGEGSLRWALIDAGPSGRAFVLETQTPGRRVSLSA